MIRRGTSLWSGVAVILSVMTILLIVGVFALAALTPVPPPSPKMSIFTSHGECIRDHRSLTQALCEELPNHVFEPGASDFERTTAIRRWVHQNADLATDKVRAGPRWHVNTTDQMYQSFTADETGVWCTGSALFLSRIYKQTGYRAWILSYGLWPDLMTHASTIVEIQTEDGPKLIIQDSYFNFTVVGQEGHPMDVREVISVLADHRVDDLVFRHSEPLDKEIIVTAEQAEKAQTEGRIIWVDVEKGSCEANDQGNHRCRVTSATFQNLIERHKVSAATLDAFEERGLPRQMEYLMVFPYDIFTPSDDYFSDPTENPLLAEVFEASGGYAEVLDIQG
jgi:hypothetical protein